MDMSIPESLPLSIPILNLAMIEIAGKGKPVTVDTITYEYDTRSTTSSTDSFS